MTAWTKILTIGGHKLNRTLNTQMAGMGKSVLTFWDVMFAVWVMATFASFRTRSVNELLDSRGFDFQVLFQTASWGLFFLFAVYLFVSGRFSTAIMAKGPVFWYSVFVGLATFSILYSDTRVLTLYYVMQLFALVVIVCSMKYKLNAIYELVAIYAVLNWLLLILGTIGVTFGQEWITTAEVSYARYGGSAGELWRFSTAFGHPSQLSIVCAMAAVGLAAQNKRWQFKKTIILMLTLTVVLTLSRTAILGMILGFIFVLWIRGYLLSTILAGTIMCPILLFPDVSDNLQVMIMRGQSESEFASLTGRSAIYKVAWARADGNWLGEGFRSLRGAPLIDREWGQGVLHAHNLFLNAFIELGVAGALAATATLVSLSIYAIDLAWPSRGQSNDNPIKDFESLAIVFPILAFCTFDSGFAMNANIFTIMFILVCAHAKYKTLNRFSH